MDPQACLHLGSPQALTTTLLAAALSLSLSHSQLFEPCPAVQELEALRVQLCLLLAEFIPQLVSARILIVDLTYKPFNQIISCFSDSTHTDTRDGEKGEENERVAERDKEREERRGQRERDRERENEKDKHRKTERERERERPSLQKSCKISHDYVPKPGSTHSCIPCTAHLRAPASSASEGPDLVKRASERVLFG